MNNQLGNFLLSFICPDFLYDEIRLFMSSTTNIGYNTSLPQKNSDSLFLISKSNFTLVPVDCTSQKLCN
jgi:hypothetical protein